MNRTLDTLRIQEMRYAVLASNGASMREPLFDTFADAEAFINELGADYDNQAFYVAETISVALKVG